MSGASPMTSNSTSRSSSSLPTNKHAIFFIPFVETEHIGKKKKKRKRKTGHIRVQKVHEERVVLEEIIGLEAAAITDPKVRQPFVVVGLEERADENRHLRNVQPSNAAFAQDNQHDREVKMLLMHVAAAAAAAFFRCYEELDLA